eukprot:scaffold71162_cov73-Phaeocystis_antarctica.AAC.7
MDYVSDNFRETPMSSVRCSMRVLNSVCARFCSSRVSGTGLLFRSPLTGHVARSEVNARSELFGGLLHRRGSSARSSVHGPAIVRRSTCSRTPTRRAGRGGRRLTTTGLSIRQKKSDGCRPELDSSTIVIEKTGSGARTSSPVCPVRHL